jgi:WD40 repeat protein/predicted Ser/Thr protein kinase
MGEVYRARDMRLDRTVAIKVLPQHLSSNPDVRQRFEREAKTISQLSHPHICALYDVGREGETEYLVMELLEGQTMSERLAKGPLPLEQMLRHGIEIADALDKAHRQGIVHRDLKPSNVMLTKSGVKLLDFGLAKAIEPSAPMPLTSLPTQASPVTQAGTVLGTFQYMAPEQLEGKEADARSDIFAFGALLYEMGTGTKAFSGTTQASLMGAILHTEPPPISQVQPMTPQALDRVVKTCLAKDPEDRWQSAADIKRELRWLGDGSQATAVAAAPAARGSWLPWTIAALAVVVATGLAVRSRGSAPAAAERMQLAIVPPERTVLTEFFAVSPDGKKLAFVGIAGGKSLLRIRDLGSDEVRALAGTDSAETVFWSPDGRSLGVVARGKLRRIDLATGSIEILCDASAGRGGDWGPKGEILLAQKSVGAIYRVPASGGPAIAATTLEKGDLLHRWPQFLPDGRRFLFFAKTEKPETTGTYLASLGAPGRKLLLRNGATGVFVPPETLLFVRGEALLAQRLDLDRGELTGEPETVIHPVRRGELGSFRDLFTTSTSGIAVFRSGSAERRLTWVDRRGNVLKTVGPPGVVMNVSLSPNDREGGFTVRSMETGIDTVWIIDFDRDVTTPFAEPGFMPTWTPDGDSIFYSYRGETYEIRRKAMRGDPKEESIGVVDNFATPHGISSDGRYLLYTRMGGNFDVGVKDLQGHGKPQILLGSEFAELMPHFSPDGRWFVYSSDEPGQSEIFVRRFPMTDEKWRISTAGGEQPIWSRDGKEIFFIALDDRLMAVPVSTGSSFSSGTPQLLFRSGLKLDVVGNQYAASADGQQFLMVVPTQDLDAEPFRVLLNWRSRP